MTILPILITGEPVLHRKAEPVAEITPEITALIEDMFETMDAAPGVGLAAPQIGVGLRIFVYDYEFDETRLRGVAINPSLIISEIENIEPDPETESEGCLSIPTERFPLKRAQEAVLKALDEKGNEYELSVHGWMARIFQHEFDHLDGILYADRLISPHREEAQQAIKEYGWGVPGISWQPGEDDLEP
ncbi:MAG: peptide deformylase [Actinomycetota bacterium]